MRTPVQSVAIALAVLAAFACPARSAWDAPGGALLAPASAGARPLLAIADGVGGAFVVLAGQGIAVQHLDAAGDIVAGWPAAGTDVSGGTSLPGGPPCSPQALPDISAASDGAGGVYVTWGGAPVLSLTNSPTLYVQHVGANGLLAAGWSSGAHTATTSAGQESALAYPDGTGGVFVLWHDRRRLITDQDDPHIMLQHFLANGSRAIGFAALGRFLGANLPPIPAPRIAAVFAADPILGAWAVVTRASSDTTQSPSGFVIMRIDTTGLVADGWGEDGIMLPGPSADVGDPASRAARLFPDGSGGAWALIASGARGRVIAFHQLGDGSFDPALPAEGLTLAATPDLAVDPDGVGGFFARHEVSDFPYPLAVQRVLPGGGVDPAWGAPVEITGGRDAQLFPTADGALGVGWVESASVNCDAEAGDVLVGRLKRDGTVPPDWPADQTGAGTWGVAAATNVSYATPEFASAACPDGLGGYVVCWATLPPGNSEAHAMRYTLQGAVAGVARSAGVAPTLRAPRFTRAGIRVQVSGTLPEGARLDAHDLLGRRVARLELPAGVAQSEFTLPGTDALRPGIYFLALRASSEAAHAKVLVVR